MMLAAIVLVALVSLASGYYFASTKADMLCRETVEREFGGTK